VATTPSQCRRADQRREKDDVNSQESLAEVFVQIADTLVADFDIIDFLQHLCDRCVELLGVDAAGLLLADSQGQLQIMAATSEQARLLELFQLQSGEGPCLDCHRDGQAVVIADVSTVTARWPRFAPACRQAGFEAVHAMPMRCRDQVVGAMNLFQTAPGPLEPSIVRIAQALTDAATIGLLQQRAMYDQHVLVEQLQVALNSRIVIEQATGILAERVGLDVGNAFNAMRQQARNQNLGLTDLARMVIDGTEQTPGPGPGPGRTARR
jgi:GAF domain-containing protein